MAYYFLFPEKDATVYSHPDRDKMNTGHDEIIELVKEKSTTGSFYYPSRILMKFKDSEIKDVIQNKSGNQYTANLQLFSTEHKNLAANHTIETNLIIKSWDEGTGRYSNLPTSSNGVSWRYRDNDTSKTEWITSSFDGGTTGSILNSTHLNPGGGEWAINFVVTQSFSNSEDLDTNINVTSLVDEISSSIFSQTGINLYEGGFLIRKIESVENSISSSFGELKYFSTDTHTIYPPRLAFKWDDSIHNYGSQLSTKHSGELNVSLYRNKEEYNQNEEAMFRIHVRDKYPTRSFTTSSNYLDVGYFKTTSYYSIRDAATEDIIIPFDDSYTKLSADNEGMYFKIHMNGLQPERYYRLLFKHINNDGITIYDNDYYFKVVR
tara:strand:- start:10919 stop:12052 length:1134 start_codon:yes stop_codon:yes gene_type:complete